MGRTRFRRPGVLSARVAKSRVWACVLVCPLACGCFGGAAASVTHAAVPPRHVVADQFRLLPVPRRATTVCAEQARRTAFSVLCPTLLPRASTGTRPGDRPARLRASSYPRVSRYAYGVVFTYNAPWEQPNKQRLNSPRRFLHFEVLGLITKRIPPEAFIRLVVDPRIRASRGDFFLRRLRTMTLGGHRGVLYAGLPYNRGGNELGGHLTFIWHDQNVTRVASLHAWTPRRQTLAVLRALIESLKPEPVSSP
jgi:hypothetical protein